MENVLTEITTYLLRQSWQIAVLFVLVAGASVALRKASAHWRYLLWLVVLAKCLVPPLVLVPVAVLPERQPREMQPAPAPVAEALPPAAGPTDPGAFEPVEAPLPPAEIAAAGEPAAPPAPAVPAEPPGDWPPP